MSYPSGTEPITNSEQISVYFLFELCCSFTYKVKQKQMSFSKKKKQKLEFVWCNWQDEILDDSPAFVYKIWEYYLHSAKRGWFILKMISQKKKSDKVPLHGVPKTEDS